MSSLVPRTDERRWGRPELPSRRTSPRGVLLVNLGTPDGPDVASVRRYLREFLSDPDVIQLPRGMKWFNRVLGWLIARFRAPKSAGLYQRIWTDRGSPLAAVTAEQASLLEAALGEEYRVFHAMRYGSPSIASRLREIEEAGIDELVVIPLYPQFSGTTTGTALRELYRSLDRGEHRINVTTRNAWYDDGGYVHAQARLIEEYVKCHALSPENAVLLFSAHGLPVSYVERGDPYPEHMKRTVELVGKRLGWPADRMRLTYQSRLGPAQWLGPHTGDVLRELGEAGQKRVLVCPVSFTTDCLETLEEIDVRYRSEFEKDGCELFLCPALNTKREFIAALKNLVLRGPKPVTCWGEKVRPLLYQERAGVPTPANVESLVMVGMSLDSRVGHGYGPDVVHADSSTLSLTKRSQHEIPEALRKICAGGYVHEAFLWNTCHRFEFYGWPTEAADSKEHCIVARVQQNLFNGHTPEDLMVNVLCGADAWQHLVRTVAGLNSSIPGDHDIPDQLRQAQLFAERAGTAGPMTTQLIDEAVRLEGALRRQTNWGRFAPSYCYAALSRIAEEKKLDLADCRCVIIGGSSTSRSVLANLIDRFDVPSRELTLVYRGHGGGQIKLLRKAVRNGRRIRVQSYAEPQVLKAIAEADVVFYGIDHEEPVLHANELRELRDFAARPLTVVDFNTFGSTAGLDTLPGVTLVDAEGVDKAVRAFAGAMCVTEAFSRAVEEAERWIAERVPSWHGSQSRPHRCHRIALEAAERAGLPALVRIQERWQRCVRCAEGVDTEEHAVLERKAS
jgi:ferrochelatase